MKEFLIKLWNIVKDIYVSTPPVVKKSILVFVGICFFGGVINAFFHKVKSDEEEEYDAKVKAGKKFEKIVRKNLMKVFNCPVYKNLIFTADNGNDTEVDIAFVTCKGIFSVECKYKKADEDCTYLSCSSGAENWRYMVGRADYIESNGVGYTPIESLKNPLKQNAHHIEAIENAINNAHCYNMVIVNHPIKYIDNDSGRMGKGYSYCEPDIDKNIIAHHDKTTLKTIKKKFKVLPDVYTKKELSGIESVLKVHEATRTQLKTRAKKYKAIPFTDEEISKFED